MPDVWTANPEKLRTALKELGAVCGEPPRVFKDRDPEWTCHIDDSQWLRDVYIHPFEDFFWGEFFVWPIVMAICVGIMIGLFFGKMALYKSS